MLVFTFDRYAYRGGMMSKKLEKSKGQPFYATALQQYLAEGKNKIMIAIWGEHDRANAQSYVDANGGATAASPRPDIVIVVTSDGSLRNGCIKDGRAVIRYAYGARSL